MTPKTRVNSSGYNLAACLGDAARLNFTQIFLASEGTLGLILEIRLRLAPLPAHTLTAVLGFQSLDACSEAVQRLRPLKPAALEIIDD